MKQDGWYGRVFRDREIWFCLALLCCIVWESALLMGMALRHETICKGAYALALGIIADTVEEEIQAMPTDLEKCSFGDSFLSDRSYGGERKHYGTDLMDLEDIPGSLPIYSMTQGIVTNLGWNELGGWRVGVTSPSGVYYYYAHAVCLCIGTGRRGSCGTGRFSGIYGRLRLWRRRNHRTISHASASGDPDLSRDRR